MTANTVSDREWGTISESDYEDAEDYCKASLIHGHGASGKATKGTCKLPVYEPKQLGGKLNRNGMHAAASVLAGGRGGVNASAEDKQAAARKLVELYKKIGEEPPDSLRELV
jgi:hypothetical protein